MAKMGWFLFLGILGFSLNVFAQDIAPPLKTPAECSNLEYVRAKFRSFALYTHALAQEPVAKAGFYAGVAAAGYVVADKSANLQWRYNHVVGHAREDRRFADGAKKLILRDGSTYYSASDLAFYEGKAVEAETRVARFSRWGKHATKLNKIAPIMWIAEIIIAGIDASDFLGSVGASPFSMTPGFVDEDPSVLAAPQVSFDEACKNAMRSEKVRAFYQQARLGVDILEENPIVVGEAMKEMSAHVRLFDNTNPGLFKKPTNNTNSSTVDR
jgi:hypothetical protein